MWQDVRVQTETAQPTWRKSSFCASGACVEVNPDGQGGSVMLRDGKDPNASPVLQFTDQAWLEFTAGVKAGQFDGKVTA